MSAAAGATLAAHPPRRIAPALRPRWIRAAVACSLIAVVVLAAQWAGGDEVGQDRSAAREIIARANAMRAQDGLRPLAASEDLTRAAEAYAREQAIDGTLDHTGSNGSTLDARAEAHGYRAWSVLAENLASGFGARDAAGIVAAWLRSAEHRRNLLSPEVREAGAACYVERAQVTRYWCVLEFGAQGP